MPSLDEIPYQRPCRACGELLEFRLTPSGKRAPINLRTGESHFVDCPLKRLWKKVEAPARKHRTDLSKKSEPIQATYLSDDDAPITPEKTRGYYDD